MFKLLRSFSLSGLIGVLLAGAVLGGVYRYVAVQSLVQLGEENNTSLARSMAGALGAQLDHHHLALDVRAFRKVEQLDHVDELVQLLGHLFDYAVVSGGDDGHL